MRSRGWWLIVSRANCFDEWSRQLWSSMLDDRKVVERFKNCIDARNSQSLSISVRFDDWALRFTFSSLIGWMLRAVCGSGKAQTVLSKSTSSKRSSTFCLNQKSRSNLSYWIFRSLLQDFTLLKAILPGLCSSIFHQFTENKITSKSHKRLSCPSCSVVGQAFS